MMNEWQKINKTLANDSERKKAGEQWTGTKLRKFNVALKIPKDVSRKTVAHYPKKSPKT